MLIDPKWGAIDSFIYFSPFVIPSERNFHRREVGNDEKVLAANLRHPIENNNSLKLSKGEV